MLRMTMRLNGTAVRLSAKTRLCTGHNGRKIDFVRHAREEKVIFWVALLVLVDMSQPPAGLCVLRRCCKLLLQVAHSLHPWKRMLPCELLAWPTVCMLRYVGMLRDIIQTASILSFSTRSSKTSLGPSSATALADVWRSIATGLAPGMYVARFFLQQLTPGVHAV